MARNLSADNWREPDPLTGGLTGGLWPELVLAPRLSDAIPEDVRNMFEAARAAMLYGELYYPLITLGSEELHRACDAATIDACEALGGKTVKSFADRIAWLRQQGVFDERDFLRWDGIRKLRNESSHARFRCIFSPPMALDLLRATVEDLNNLFRIVRERGSTRTQ